MHASVSPGCRMKGAGRLWEVVACALERAWLLGLPDCWGCVGPSPAFASLLCDTGQGLYLCALIAHLQSGGGSVGWLLGPQGVSVLLLSTKWATATLMLQMGALRLPQSCYWELGSGLEAEAFPTP